MLQGIEIGDAPAPQEDTGSPDAGQATGVEFDAALDEVVSAQLGVCAQPGAGCDEVALTLAEVGDIIGRDDAPESTIGGQTTCIVCFANPKSHVAVPCGHQCACADCSASMDKCPVCRKPVAMWMQVHMA